MSSAHSPQPKPRARQYAAAEADVRRRSQELGLLGKIFGSRDHAPVNIAGFIVVLGLFGILATPLLPEKSSLAQADWVKLLSGLVLSALTFLGGYLGGSKKD